MFWGLVGTSGVGRILVWRRIEAPRGWGAGIFDYLILKWRILMHISGILTYLF